MTKICPFCTLQRNKKKRFNLICLSCRRSVRCTNGERLFSQHCPCTVTTRQDTGSNGTHQDAVASSFLPTRSMEQSRERYPGDRALPVAPTAKQALTPKSAWDWRKSSSSSSKFLQHRDLPSLALRKPHAEQRAAERAHTCSLQPSPSREHWGDWGYSTANKPLAPESLHPSAVLVFQPQDKDSKKLLQI